MIEAVEAVERAESQEEEPTSSLSLLEESEISASSSQRPANEHQINYLQDRKVDASKMTEKQASEMIATLESAEELLRTEQLGRAGAQSSSMPSTSPSSSLEKDEQDISDAEFVETSASSGAESKSQEQEESPAVYRRSPYRSQRHHPYQ